LLTASTSKADHLGCRRLGYCGLSIVPVSFSRFVVLVLGLKHAFFPLRSEVGTRVGARKTRDCRNAVEDSEALRRVVGRAPVPQSRRRRGKLMSAFFSAGMERSGMKARPQKKDQLKQRAWSNVRASALLK